MQSETIIITILNHIQPRIRKDLWRALLFTRLTVIKSEIYEKFKLQLLGSIPQPIRLLHSPVASGAMEWIRRQIKKVFPVVSQYFYLLSTDESFTSILKQSIPNSFHEIDMDFLLDLVRINKHEYNQIVAYARHSPKKEIFLFGDALILFVEFCRFTYIPDKL